MNVGIIGGADGPTQIFVSGGSEWAIIAAGGALIVLGAVIAFFVVRNRRKTRKDDIND